MSGKDNIDLEEMIFYKNGFGYCARKAARYEGIKCYLNKRVMMIMMIVIVMMAAAWEPLPQIPHKLVC